jgi:hypothetical protein
VLPLSGIEQHGPVSPEGHFAVLAGRRDDAADIGNVARGRPITSSADDQTDPRPLHPASTVDRGWAVSVAFAAAISSSSLRLRFAIAHP